MPKNRALRLRNPAERVIVSHRMCANGGMADAPDLGSKFGKISSAGFHLQNSEFKLTIATLTAIFDPG